MAELVIVVLVTGVVLALAGGLLYYKSKAESSGKDAAETEVAKDVAEDRATAAEDSVAKRNAERYAQALENSKNATLEIALRNWAAAGKLRDPDGSGGTPSNPGAVPSW